MQAKKHLSLSGHGSVLSRGCVCSSEQFGVRMLCARRRYRRTGTPGTLARRHAVPPGTAVLCRSAVIYVVSRSTAAVSDTQRRWSALLASGYWSYLPVTVAAFAAVGWVLVVLDVPQFQIPFLPSLWDPLELLSSMLFHEGMGHYRGNMLYAFVPFGVVLTLLTSNRHVLGVVLVSHGVPALLLGWLGWLGVGSSIAAFGVLSATLVRSVGLATQNESDATVLATAFGLLVPFLATLWLLALINVPPDISHVGHFLGFLCGAGYESASVLVERARQRSEPRQ